VGISCAGYPTEFVCLFEFLGPWISFIAFTLKTIEGDVNHLQNHLESNYLWSHGLECLNFQVYILFFLLLLLRLLDYFQSTQSLLRPYGPGDVKRGQRVRLPHSHL
jgi:hypothetical protein